jgi:hypothetical protein
MEIETSINIGWRGCPVRTSKPLRTLYLNTFFGTLDKPPDAFTGGRVFGLGTLKNVVVNGLLRLLTSTPTWVPPRAET